MSKNNSDDDRHCDCEKDSSDVSKEISTGVQMDELPDEILEFVLSYLPPYKDLECCRLVCKRWNAVVKNLVRRFKMNLHKGLLDYRLRWEVLSQQASVMANLKQLQPASTVASKIINPPLSSIAGRFSHSAVRHGNSMYVFGGGSSSDTTFNDLWRFDLSEMCWERPLSMGSYPSPKGSASIVCWRENLVLFGGWRYPSLHPPFQPWCLFDELHYYDLASNRWTVRITMPSPPPMAGHSASVHGDRMVVFGGYQISDGVRSNSNETWCLDLQEHKWWQPRFVGNTKPPPRYGQFQLELSDEYLLIVGGCGGPNSVYSDAWLLDMSRDVWAWRSIPVRNKKFGATHMWCNPACKIDSKLVVLGPTPNMPQDFQMVKQTRLSVGGGVGGGMHAPGRLLAGDDGGVRMQNNRNNPFAEQRQHQAFGAAGGGGAGGLPARIVLPPANHNHLDNARPGPGVGHGPDEQYLVNRRAILQQHQINANNNIFNNNNNNNLQPRAGRLSDLHNSSAAAVATAVGSEERNQNRPRGSSLNGASSSSSSSTITQRCNDNEASAIAAAVAHTNGSVPSNAVNNLNDIEAANRLQRNLALRCRDNEPLLPKRFDELYEDPFRMAAFNVQSRPRSVSKDHNERIRRMEEKMTALRNSRRSAAQVEQKSIKEPSPKRVKRNVLSLFVCDLSAVLDANDPHLQWIEHKNYGLIPGAPERLILSTMVAGHGELILFGGVHKETLGEISHHVSNSVHFLSAPREII